MQLLTTILGGAVGAAIVTGIFALIKFKMERKAAKEDKHDDVLDAIKKLDNKVSEVEYKVRESTAIIARRAILRFGDEIDHGVKHSREHFQQILLDTDDYGKWCEENPDFKNSITVHTTDKIKETYKKCEEQHDFL